MEKETIFLIAEEGWHYALIDGATFAAKDGHFVSDNKRGVELLNPEAIGRDIKNSKYDLQFDAFVDHNENAIRKLGITEENEKDFYDFIRSDGAYERPVLKIKIIGFWQDEWVEYTAVLDYDLKDAAERYLSKQTKK